MRMKNACFRDEGASDWTLENFKRQFIDPPFADYDRIFIALAGNRIVGTTSAWEIDFGEGPVGLIHWVGVEPEYRRRGLAR